MGTLAAAPAIIPSEGGYPSIYRSRNPRASVLYQLIEALGAGHATQPQCYADGPKVSPYVEFVGWRSNSSGTLAKPPITRRNMACRSTKRRQCSSTLSITIGDPEHSESENRFVDVGMSHRGQLLVVSYTEREDRIRIISARPATRAERKSYEETDYGKAV